MNKKIREEQAEEDKRLIVKALNNSQLAYEKLMGRYYDSIYFMILQLVHNMTDAGELAQETFSKAFNNLDKYNNKYPFSSWLFSIASNTSIDFLRKKKNRDISLDPHNELTDINMPESLRLNPEEDYIQKQEVKDLKKKIKGLKEQYRVLIELRYFEEYTYDEIANELSLPIGTVKTRLHRAKAQLIKKMSRNR